MHSLTVSSCSPHHLFHSLFSSRDLQRWKQERAAWQKWHRSSLTWQSCESLLLLFPLPEIQGLATVQPPPQSRIVRRNVGAMVTVSICYRRGHLSPSGVTLWLVSGRMALEIGCLCCFSPHCSCWLIPLFGNADAWAQVNQVSARQDTCH